MRKYIFNKNIFALIVNLSALLIIITMMVNMIHQDSNNLIRGLQPYLLDGKVTKNYDGIDEEIVRKQKNLTLWTQEKVNPKIKISEYLTNIKSYKMFFTRSCKAGEYVQLQEHRKKGRWVGAYTHYNLYKFGEQFSDSAPYYIHILLYSIILFATYLLTFKTFTLNWTYRFIFLFYISCILQNPISEFFSIIDAFLMSLALYASKFKRFYLFIFTVIIAQLNRETGILFSILWMVFNKEYIKVIIAGFLATSVYLIMNFDLIKCVMNPSFYGVGVNETTRGNIHWRDLGTKVGILSTIKLVSINFIIPFGFLFYILLSTQKKNRAIILLSVIYLFIFIFGMPLQQVSARLLLLPLLMSALYFRQLENN